MSVSTSCRWSVVMLAFALVCLAGWSRPAQAADKVAVQLNWLPEPEFGGIYAAELTGAFKKHNLEVTILKGGPDVPAVQMTAVGKVTFGIAAADEVVTMREKGADLVSVFTIYQTSPQGLMVHPDRPVRSLEQLAKAGGTMVVQPGLAYVKFLKRAYGLRDVKLVPYQGGVSQFLSGKDVAQQCFVFAEPLVAKRQGVEPRVFMISESGFNPYTGVVIVRGEYLRENRDVVRRFVLALREGWRTYLDNPVPANTVMARLNSAMDLQTFADAAKAQMPLIEDEFTKQHGLGVMSVERWETLIRQLRELDLIKAPPAARDCFVNLN